MQSAFTTWVSKHQNQNPDTSGSPAELPVPEARSGDPRRWVGVARSVFCPFLATTGLMSQQLCRGEGQGPKWPTTLPVADVAALFQ